MDFICTSTGSISEHGHEYVCRSPLAPATKPHCHASFNLPLGSSLRSIDHLQTFLKTTTDERSLTNVRVWALKVFQGNVGQGQNFILSWTLEDARVSKDRDFKPCFDASGQLGLKAVVYIDPPKK